MNRKQDGFHGQKAIVIPRKIIEEMCANHPVIGNLYITDIGYYPKARFHYRERPNGAEQHILIYCIEGKGEATINGVSFSLKAGDYFMVPAKVAHQYASNEKKPWTIFWIHFKGSATDTMVDLFIKQMGSYSGTKLDSKKSVDLFDEMYLQLERGYSGEHLLYSNMCLMHYLATFIFPDYSSGSALPDQDNSNLAIDFLNKNLDRTLSLKEMASKVNLTPSHFSFMFKKKTGFTPIEYFNHLKVQKACQYLLFTELRVKEIAFELGIDDQFYFSRMFTKVMGMPPNDYREKKIH